MIYKGNKHNSKNMDNTKSADKQEDVKLNVDKEEIVDKQQTQEHEQQVEDQTVEQVQEESKEKELEEKLAQANDKYIRMAAEFDNYRRRVSKERLELLSTASEDVIKGMLTVLDDCQRALKVLKDSNADKSAIEGTELILNKLFSYLQTKGLAEMNTLGQELNTDFHEAVAQFPVEEKDKKNKIIDIVQQGYTLNGKVIRFAKVVVGI